jgi:hypothetical protein
LVLWEVRCKMLIMPMLLNVQRDSYLCWPIHGSALYSIQCSASCKVHNSFADESLWVLADNVRN